MTSPAETTAKFTVLLLEQAQQQMEGLRIMTGQSKTESVNRAISLYHFWQQAKRDGWQLALYHSDRDVFRVVKFSDEDA